MSGFRCKGVAMLAGSTIYMAMIGAFALAHRFVLAVACRVRAIYLTCSNVTPIGVLITGFLISD